MDPSRYQATEAAALECRKTANSLTTLAVASLGWAVGFNTMPHSVRLAASVAAVFCAWQAKEASQSARALEAKVQQFRYQFEDLEATQSALEYANAKTALEESYGLISPEDPGIPEIEQIEPLILDVPKVSKSRVEYQPEYPDDYGFAAMAPDAQKELRSWLNIDFACSSKVICADTGSGKSSYLRWEYRQASRDRTTYLIDGHLPSNHLEGVYWSGSKESDLRIVSHSPYQIERTLTDLIEEVKERLQGLRTLEPVHVIIDEADGNIFKTSSTRKLLHTFVELVANEARKTKVTLTFVVHSIQKQKTGIDASDLVQIRWLIMGNALVAPHSSWPGDLNVKLWRQKQTTLQDTMDLDTARVCICYLKNKISLEIIEWEHIQNY